MDAVPKTWSLTKEGLDRLLHCLNPDREVAGRQYELIRSKLISYFDWRDCPFPEEHADEAINRVIKKLEAGEEFRELGTYVFGIARMMVLEIGRTRDRERVLLEQRDTPKPVAEVESEELDRKVECLKKCLATLTDRSRQLIVDYYQGEGSAKIKKRKELAERMGLQLNALRIRACRLRATLEDCMQRCLTSNGKDDLVSEYGAGNE